MNNYECGMIDVKEFEIPLQINLSIITEGKIIIKVNNDGKYVIESDPGMLHHTQELVRCKDCKHAINATYNLKENRISSVACDKVEIHEPDWFCADGERK